MMKLIRLMQSELNSIEEMMPWDLDEHLEKNKDSLILDVREVAEYDRMHVKGSLNVPRGILESACEWNFDETESRLVESRDKEVIVVCRSGHRSLLAAYTLSLLGFEHVYSLKTGLRGWNDYELPLIDTKGNAVDEGVADDFFTSRLREDQRSPS